MGGATLEITTSQVGQILAEHISTLSEDDAISFLRKVVHHISQRHPALNLQHNWADSYAKAVTKNVVLTSRLYEVEAANSKLVKALEAAQ